MDRISIFTKQKNTLYFGPDMFPEGTRYSGYPPESAIALTESYVIN